MSPEVVIGIVLTSNVIVVFITKWFERKLQQAGTIKLRNESGQIILEGELKVTEFYKKQLEAILDKYNLLELKLDREIAEHRSCEEKIYNLQQKYDHLQREFTLFKSQASGNL